MTLWNASDKKPTYVKETDKRNVVADKTGWAQKTNYTGVGGIVRNKSETLVAIRELVDNSSPVVSEIYVANSTGGSTLVKGAVTTVNVVFTEPVTIGSSANAMTLAVANTAGGAAATATASTDKTKIVNANNTVVFNVTLSTAGTYGIAEQEISANNAKLYSISGGVSELANTSISEDVAAAVATFSIS